MLNNYKQKILKFIRVDLIKHFFIYSFGTIIYSLAQFLLIPIFTRSFAPEEYGKLELVNVTSTIILYITIFGLHQLIQVEYYKLTIENKKTFFSDIALIFILISTPLYIVILICYFILKYFSLLNDNSYLLFIGIITSYFNVIIYLYLYYLQISKQAKKYAAIRSLNGIALIGINLLLIFYLKIGIASYLLSNLFFNILLLTYAIQEYKNKIGFGFNYKNIFRLKKYLIQGSPFLLTTLIYFFTTNFDKYIISLFLSNQDVGIYSVAYRFGQSYEAFFIGPVSLAYSAHLFEKFSKGDFTQNYKVITIGSLILFTFFAIITPFIAYFIVGTNYRESLAYIPFLILGYGLVFINTFFILVINYFKKGKVLVSNSIITLLVYLISNIIFVNTFKLWGAVLTFILSNLVFLFLSYFSVKRIMTEENKALLKNSL